MIYGYARVSTKGQAKDGNSLESQVKTLTEHGATQIFKDSFTGTKKHRPELDKLLAVVKAGDTIIVTKLDRIARSAIQGCELVNELLAKGVTINVLNMGVMDNSTTGKLIRTIFFAFAEFERDMIVERTSEGKEVARLDPDYREGRKRKDTENFEEIYLQVNYGKLTVAKACEMLSISRATYFNRAKEMRI